MVVGDGAGTGRGLRAQGLILRGAEGSLVSSPWLLLPGGGGEGLGSGSCCALPSFSPVTLMGFHLDVPEGKSSSAGPDPATLVVVGLP